MLRSYRFCILCGVAAALIAILLSMSTPAQAADKPVSFIADVAPILKENCFACHDTKKKSGKYDMTTYERLMAGGDDGGAVTAGKPDDSDCYTLMNSDEQRRMPPRDKGAAVPKAKAEIVKRWIAEGAKLDAGLDPKADLVAELRRRWTPPMPPEMYAKPVVINAISFTPDGKSIVVGGHHELTVWDVATGQLQKRMRMRPERVYSMAFTKNGKLAVAGGRPGQEGEVRLYDLTASGQTNMAGVMVLDGVNGFKARGKLLWEGDDCGLCLAMNSDGTKLAAGGTDRIVRVWNVTDDQNPKLEQTIENHADWVLGVCFTADGKFLYTAGRDKTAKVWDLTKKESILTMAEHQAVVYGVAAKADGSLAFSVGADKLLRAWKPLGDGKSGKAGAIHTDEVLKVLMHPTKSVLFTASADKVVRSWDATDKFPLLKRFEGHSDVVYALALSPDGKLVAAGGYDGEVRIWTSDDAKLVTAFIASPGYKAPTPAASGK
ncbi:hypothetical protein BH11PLA2_BH11PLA2_36810 [soil metagenome]